MLAQASVSESARAVEAPTHAGSAPFRHPSPLQQSETGRDWLWTRFCPMDHGMRGKGGPLRSQLGLPGARCPGVGASLPGANAETRDRDVAEMFRSQVGGCVSVSESSLFLPERTNNTRPPEEHCCSYSGNTMGATAGNGRKEESTKHQTSSKHMEDLLS